MLLNPNPNDNAFLAVVQETESRQNEERFKQQTFFCPRDHQIPVQCGFCVKCAKCFICGQQLTYVEYNVAMRLSPEDLKNPEIYVHSRCAAAQIEIAKDSEVITLTKLQFDHLNAARLLLLVNPSVNAETNEREAEHIANRFFVDMPLEEQYLTMRRTMAITAVLSFLTGTNKLKIKADLEKRDAGRMAGAVKAERLENRPKAEKKTLDGREKAILAMMTLAGLSRADAEKTVDAPLRAQGKVTE